ncbi:Vacuolar acid trehalase [Heracleum sosnowskyi]|uniref:Vacuolar acid trehalase n=1 Tax=Heracleum sosnowskyi TaxID=360622 RepID=A0AAD8J652_9APIA|nr:Vacuolar acid trehalase [Heracleum sosnowskyi]
MASALTTQNFICSLPSLKPYTTNIPKSLVPSSLSNYNTPHVFKTKLLRRASSQELPDEFTEDSKFVPLNTEDPIFGPPALLLLGFRREEFAKVQMLLKELEGEFLKIIVCTEDMISGSLWDAINTKQSNPEAVKGAASLPRICFLSGLTGEEMLMFIDAFPEFGIEPPVFAALVPNSAEKPLKEVMEEIMGDHEMMSARQLD